MTFKGMEEYIAQLQRLQNVSRECIGRSVYEGAGLVADKVKDAIQALPIDNRSFVKDGEMLNGINAIQKAGLIEGFGISHMQDDNGYLNVKLGFEGYNNLRTKAFPNGQPNSMIARSVNSGSSFRQRIPFVDQAVRSNKSACEQKMKEQFDKEVKKVIS